MPMLLLLLLLMVLPLLLLMMAAAAAAAAAVADSSLCGCRLTLTQASVSVSADAVVSAARDFGERTARETCAREEATGRKVRPLPAWHHILLHRIKSPWMQLHALLHGPVPSAWHKDSGRYGIKPLCMASAPSCMAHDPPGMAHGPPGMAHNPPGMAQEPRPAYYPWQESAGPEWPPETLVYDE